MEEIAGAARRYLYYILIGLLSLVAMLFLPMVGSEVGMGFKVPTTLSGWIVFVSGKAMVALINVLIFHSFILQARVNVRDDPAYMEAREILADTKDRKAKPRSPSEVNKREYGAKATSIFFSSIAGSFSLGQAILTYDWMQLLTYVFTIMMGLVFGILEMKKYEDYYTGEFLLYAKMKKKEETNNDNGGREGVSEPARAGGMEQG